MKKVDQRIILSVFTYKPSIFGVMLKYGSHMSLSLECISYLKSIEHAWHSIRRNQNMRNAVVAYRNHENSLLFRNRITLHYNIDKFLFISDRFK